MWFTIAKNLTFKMSAPQEVKIKRTGKTKLWREEFLYIVYNTETAGDVNLKKIASVLKNESDNNRVVIFLSDENRISSISLILFFHPDIQRIPHISDSQLKIIHVCIDIRHPVKMQIPYKESYQTCTAMYIAYPYMP